MLVYTVMMTSDIVTRAHIPVYPYMLTKRAITAYSTPQNDQFYIHIKRNKFHKSIHVYNIYSHTQVYNFMNISSYKTMPWIQHTSIQLASHTHTHIYIYTEYIYEHLKKKYGYLILCHT